MSHFSSSFAETNEDTDNDGDHIVCPICQHKCYSDPDTHCKHVIFVVAERMLNRFNTTTEMDNWLDENIGTDPCDTISPRKLGAFCGKFDIQQDVIVEHGMCCGPVCYEYIFGFHKGN